VSSRRIATAVTVLAMASGVAWALIELGRPAERAPVAPIVMRENSGTDPGTSPDDEREEPEPTEPGGPGGNPSGGAEPPPAPPPPPAGDHDDGDGDDDDDDGDGDADD
jgi:hypothetical protein